MDIETYNFVDRVFRDYQAGKLTREMDKKREINFDINAGVSFLPETFAPTGYSFKRDNTDFINNFFV